MFRAETTEQICRGVPPWPRNALRFESLPISGTSTTTATPTDCLLGECGVRVQPHKLTFRQYLILKTAGYTPADGCEPRAQCTKNMSANERDLAPKRYSHPISAARGYGLLYTEFEAPPGVYRLPVEGTYMRQSESCFAP